MTDANDYARERACPDCEQPREVVGQVFTRDGKSLPFYLCEQCEDLSSPPALEGYRLAGLRIRDALYKAVWNSGGKTTLTMRLVPVAHPDDVWG